MTLGEKIEHHRKRLGMTQTELGARLGVQKNAVSKWECGRVESISASKLKAMAQLFDVTVSYLIDDDAGGVKEDISNDAHHIGVLYDRADEKDRLLTHSVLDKYDDEVVQIKSVSTAKKNPGGFIEIDVYDEPAAAGLGNYLDAPESSREQFPAFIVPKGTSFNFINSSSVMIPISNNSLNCFISSTTLLPETIGVCLDAIASACKSAS